MMTTTSNVAAASCQQAAPFDKMQMVETSPDQLNSVQLGSQQTKLSNSAANDDDRKPTIGGEDARPPEAKSQTGPSSSGTPQSSSSTPSTASASSKSSSTTNKLTMGKFKEKRPEPLKLNPNLNQEIPLDLSVKSAGNVPSGMGNIFNLALLHSNPMTTLETPRIVWQDNELLLSKQQSHLARLYSTSSSSTTNTSTGFLRNKLRLSSSIADDSPPITPNTPLLMEQLALANKLEPIGSAISPIFSKSSNQLPLYQQQRLSGAGSYLLDCDEQQTAAAPANFKAACLRGPAANWQPKMIEQDRTFAQQSIRFQASKVSQSASDGRQLPRRSCSSDDLSNSFSQQQQGKLFGRYLMEGNNNYQNKKSSISPLATKNYPSNGSAKNCTPTSADSGNGNRFSYSNAAVLMSSKNSETNSSSMSPTTTNISADSQASCENSNLQAPSSEAESIKQTARTPTSGVANATANLLNIHLHSPSSSNSSLQNQAPTMNNNGGQCSMFCSGPGSEALSPTILNDLLNIQHSLPRANTSLPFEQNQHELERQNLNYFQSHAVGLQHQLNQNSGFGNSTTLNTPTLISPSHLKKNSLCFLPSPTLSPMSSVFELPSPLLMFSMSTNSFGSADKIAANKQPNPSGQQQKLLPEVEAGPEAEVNGANFLDAPEGNCLDLQRANCSALKSSLSSNILSENFDDNQFVIKQNLSDSNLSHLVTSARDKVGASVVDDEAEAEAEGEGEEDKDVRMIIDFEQSSNGRPAEGERVCQQTRPATVLPRILVDSNELQAGACQDQAECSSLPNAGFSSNQNLLQFQRDSMGSKRALSQQSIQNTINVYQCERLESSSAPPDMSKLARRRPAPKLKGVPDAGQAPASRPQCSGCVASAAGSESVNHLQHYQRPLSQQNLNSQHPSTLSQNHCRAAAPYPVAAELSANRHHQWQQATIPASFAGLHQNQPASGSSNHPKCCQPSQCLEQQHQWQYQQQHFQGNLVSGPAGQQQQQAMLQQGLYQQPLAYSNFSSQSMQQLQGNNNYLEQTRRLVQADSSNSINFHPQQPIQQSSISAGELNKPPFAPNQHQCQQPVTQIASSFQMGQQEQMGSSQSCIQTARFSQCADENFNASGAMLQLRAPQRALSSTELGSLHLHPQMQQACGEPCNIARPSDGNNSIDSSSSLNPFRATLRASSACGSQTHIAVRSTSCAGSISSSASPVAAAKKYHCEQCSKSFTRSDMLTRHKRLHSGDKPFHCSECSQVFSRSDHLSTHMRTHTGVKPYECKFCSYSACRKDMITRHMKVHNRLASPAASASQTQGPNLI